MKNLFLFLVFAFGIASCSNAQNGEGREQGAFDVSTMIESRVESLTELLSLTNDQIAEVQSIYEKTLGAEGYTESSADQRHEEIMALLNADQKKIYADYLENRSSMRFGSSEGRSQMDMNQLIDSRVESLTELLSLTEEQISQVREIYEKTMGAEGLSGSSSDQRDEEIMELLDVEQKEIYKTYLDERLERMRNRQNPNSQTIQI